MSYYYNLMIVYMCVSFVVALFTMYEVLTKGKREIDNLYYGNSIVNSVLSRRACDLIACVVIFIIMPLLPILNIKRMLVK